MEVTVTTTSKATLSKRELMRICEKQIRDSALWVDANYIADGNLMLTETFRGPHSWDTELFIRKATPLDLATETVLQKLRQHLSA